jgi:hypothetical protein
LLPSAVEGEVVPDVAAVDDDVELHVLGVVGGRRGQAHGDQQVVEVAAAEVGEAGEGLLGGFGGGEIEGGDHGGAGLADDVAQGVLFALAVGPAELGLPLGGRAVLEDAGAGDGALLDDAEQAAVHALGLGAGEGGEVVLGEVAPALDRVLLLEGGEGVGGGAVEHAGLVLADALGGDEHLLAAQASLGVVDDVDAVLRLLPQGVGVAELGVVLGGLGGGGVEAGLLHVLGELGGEGLGLAHVAALLAGVGDDAGEALEDLGVEAGGVRQGSISVSAVCHSPCTTLQRGGDAVELEEVALVRVELLAVGVDRSLARPM